jgi:hypothetical protein
MVKRSLTWLAAGAAAGVVVVAALPSGATTTAARTTYSYFLRPGQSRTFNVPGEVTRIDVAGAFEGQATQTPRSKVMSATVGYDGNNHHLSWVGTNSNGSTHAGDESTSRTVARICGTTCAFTIAKLAIVTGPDRMTLVLMKHAGTPVNFKVNLWS